MDRRVQLACAWSGVVFLVLFLVGFWFVGGLVPPPKPTDSAAQVAAFYRDNQDQLRWGALISMISLAFLAPFIGLVTLKMKEKNPRLAPLAYTQLITGIALLIMILLPIALIGLAAFRPERPPEQTQLLNDVAFFCLFWVFATPTLEYLSMGAAALLDDSEDPLIPRWAGWFDIVVGVVFATGAPVIFVKTGPFAWDGELAFWAVLVVFGGWIWVTWWCLIQAIKREPA